MARRSFLKATVATGLVVTGGAATGAVGSTAKPQRPPRTSPTARRWIDAVLATQAPDGSARADGWRATQLRRQLDGRYQEFSHYFVFGDTGWTRPELDGWEEVRGP